jgi:hypothetical protein
MIPIKDNLITISYNDIFFTYTKELREDMLAVYHTDVEDLARPMMKHFSQFHDEPHVMKLEFSFGKENDRFTTFNHKFTVVPRK